MYHPLLLDYLVKQHIEELHREAANRRLVRTTREAKTHRRNAPVIRLRRAPAH